MSVIKSSPKCDLRLRSRYILPILRILVKRFRPFLLIYFPLVHAQCKCTWLYVHDFLCIFGIKKVVLLNESALRGSTEVVFRQK